MMFYLDHTSTFPNTLYKTTCTEHNLQLVSPGYETSTQLSNQLSFPLHPLLTRSHRHDNTCVKTPISNMSVPELPYSLSYRTNAYIRNTAKLIE